MNFGEPKSTDILNNIRAMKTTDDCKTVAEQIALFCSMNPKSPSATGLRAQYDKFSTPIYEEAGELVIPRLDAKDAITVCRKELQETTEPEEIIRVLKKCRDNLSKYNKAWIEEAWNCYNKLSYIHHPMHHDKREKLLKIA